MRFRRLIAFRQAPFPALRLSRLLGDGLFVLVRRCDLRFGRIRQFRWADEAPSAILNIWLFPAFRRRTSFRSAFPIGSRERPPHFDILPEIHVLRLFHPIHIAGAKQVLDMLGRGPFRLPAFHQVAPLPAAIAVAHKPTRLLFAETDQLDTGLPGG